MSNNNYPSTQRTAPIPIAPKPPRLDPAINRNDSLRRFEIGPARSVDAISVSASAPINGQSVPPCRACRYSGTRCIPSEDDDGCTHCQINGADCSLSSTASSPQSRKRKLNGAHSSHDIIGKRRFVLSPLFILSGLFPKSSQIVTNCAYIRR